MLNVFARIGTNAYVSSIGVKNLNTFLSATESPIDLLWIYRMNFDQRKLETPLPLIRLPSVTNWDIKKCDKVELKEQDGTVSNVHRLHSSFRRRIFIRSTDFSFGFGNALKIFINIFSSPFFRWTIRFSVGMFGIYVADFVNAISQVFILNSESKFLLMRFIYW